MPHMINPINRRGSIPLWELPSAYTIFISTPGLYPLSTPTHPLTRGYPQGLMTGPSYMLRWAPYLLEPTFWSPPPPQPVVNMKIWFKPNIREKRPKKFLRALRALNRWGGGTPFLPFGGGPQPVIKAWDPLELPTQRGTLLTSLSDSNVNEAHCHRIIFRMIIYIRICHAFFNVFVNKLTKQR